jgi:hypothetical protein
MFFLTSITNAAYCIAERRKPLIFRVRGFFVDALFSPASPPIEIGV